MTSPLARPAEGTDAYDGRAKRERVGRMIAWIMAVAEAPFDDDVAYRLLGKADSWMSWQTATTASGRLRPGTQTGALQSCLCRLGAMIAGVVRLLAWRKQNPWGERALGLECHSIP